MNKRERETICKVRNKMADIKNLDMVKALEKLNLYKFNQCSSSEVESN